MQLINSENLVFKEGKYAEEEKKLILNFIKEQPIAFDTEVLLNILKKELDNSQRRLDSALMDSVRNTSWGEVKAYDVAINYIVNYSKLIRLVKEGKIII